MKTQVTRRDLFLAKQGEFHKSSGGGATEVIRFEKYFSEKFTCRAENVFPLLKKNEKPVVKEKRKSSRV